LFNDKKKARPAGHNQLAVPAKKTLGGTPSRKEPKTKQSITPHAKSKHPHHLYTTPII